MTYRDPKAIELINSRYIAVKVDQDSRPDLSNRYEDYGWPATIVLNADGGEIVIRNSAESKIDVVAFLHGRSARYTSRPE